VKTKTLARYLCVVGFCFATATIEAKDVTLQYKGLTLNANLALAADKKIADGVILITHGALAHRDMEIITYVQNLLVKEKGYSTLAINLSLGVDNRHGMYDCKATHRHRNDDAAEEIGVWVEWLKNQGAKRIALLGHSRGGAQTALYASQRDNELVKAVVLMAPAIRENTNAVGYQQRYGKPLAPVLEKAQKLVKAGKGGTVLEHIDMLNCTDTSVTADSFVSYYGDELRLDTPTLIPKIHKPLLVVVAASDEVVVGLERKVAPLVDGKRVQMKIVEGAGHFFRDLYADDAVDAIDVFLKGTGYSS
jgi:pimeloyl-ACP methyl ester carboxylesterase